MTEKVKITFLGTGSAIPTERRNHPAVFLEYKQHGILFDCGESTQTQFRKAKISPTKISKIFISHWHGDHVLGLPGLLQTLALNNYNKTLEVYGPEGTYRMFDAYQQLFLKQGKKLSISVNEISEQKIQETDFFIESKKMQHDCPCLAYSFNIPEKTRIDKEKLKKLKIPNSPEIAKLLQGKKIKIQGKELDPKKIIFKEPGKKIVYLTDTKLNKNINSLIQNADLLISESTYSEQEQDLAEKYNHLTSKQIAETSKQEKVKKLVLFHLSQRHENPKNILQQAKKILKNTEVAEDLQKIQI